MSNVRWFFPAGTEIVSGIERTLGGSAARDTVAPFTGAGSLSITVPVEESPHSIAFGATFNDETTADVGGAGVSVDVAVGLGVGVSVAIGAGVNVAVAVAVVVVSGAGMEIGVGMDGENVEMGLGRGLGRKTPESGVGFQYFPISNTVATMQQRAATPPQRAFLVTMR